MERRLTTILAADIAGFSRLIGLDEDGTLTAQRGHRAELIDPLLAEHNGRIANTAGDGILVEFSSAVEAVRWAVAVQEGLQARNADLPEDRRIKFRVGINVGDVVDEDGDLLGDGVNIAARLELVAPPGGVILSGTVHDQVRDRLDLNLADLGEVQVRNIARPVRAFQVLRDGETPVRVPKPKRGWPISASSMVMILMIIAMAAVWYIQTPEFEPVDPANMAYALSDEPSIAVLAFDNLTGDPEQEHVSDGISEDIISTLARLPGVLVIARNSSFSYKGKAVDVRQIAEEMSVRYVLEGSIQSFDETVRITAQLIDAVSGQHVWSKSFDRPRADFFNVRDEITRNIVAEVNADLVTGYVDLGLEKFKSVETWLIRQKSYWHFTRYTPADNQIAIDLNQKILLIEPDSAPAYAALSWEYSFSARSGWSADREEALRIAETYAERSIDLNDQSPLGYAALAHVRGTQGRLEEAIVMQERALKFAPGDFANLAMLGVYYKRDMQVDRSASVFRQAVRVNPKAPGWAWENYGETLVTAGRHDQAIPIYLKALEHGARGFIRGEVHLGLAVCYDALGRGDEAREQIREAIKVIPEISTSLLRGLLLYKDNAYYGHWLATLKRLGLPEE